MYEVRVPALPESVADATVLGWHKRPGERVAVEDSLVDLETDKIVLEVPAPVAGVLTEILAPEGTCVPAAALLARIDTAAPAASAPRSDAPEARQSVDEPAGAPAERPAEEPPLVAPAARQLIAALALDAREIAGSGRDGRIHKADVLTWLEGREQDPAAPLTEGLRPAGAPFVGADERPEQRVPMTRLRARIAERLLEAQRTAAILTTFNEVDMSAVLELRQRHRARFEETHGVRLGLMSFFVKAAVEALQRFPLLNAAIDGTDIVYRGYCDIGIAVSTDRGLVVPILRHCEQLDMAAIERAIAEFSAKAQAGTLSFEDLTGGTFSITNGGVFGSLLSTPILNPPQSAILGMHKIEDRPVAHAGQVVIRPMMYLALSYDHRLIDGRDAVRFLVAIKELIEDPARLLLRV